MCHYLTKEGLYCIGLWGAAFPGQNNKIRILYISFLFEVEFLAVPPAAGSCSFVVLLQFNGVFKAVFRNSPCLFLHKSITKIANISHAHN